MEGIGSEVSQKIRAAIKAKLIELGAYVDDELPDYIMVMVANKRTKTQMDEDLQLFLSSNTKIFTTWLHTVLQKLQEVTVASFDAKKDSDAKKYSKKKKSENDRDGKSRRPSDDDGGKSKKHSKKHKDGKKSKKTKHKSKDQEQPRSDRLDKNDEKEKENEDGINASHNSGKVSEEKTSKSQILFLNEAVGKAILGNLKKNKKLKSDKIDSSSGSSSSSEDSVHIKKKNQADDKFSKEENNLKGDIATQKNVENEVGDFVGASEKRKGEVIEDDFNIEPLKPNSKVDSMDDNVARSVGSKESDVVVIEDEKTVSVPTEQLLKEHNKLLTEKLKAEEKDENKGIPSDSEDSISPEEMRKQLLLNRAKKKLENRKLAERMRSNSPDVIHIEETGSREISSKNFSQFSSKQDNNWSSQRSPIRLSSCQSSHSSENRDETLKVKTGENKQDYKNSEKRKSLSIWKENVDSSNHKDEKNDERQRSNERLEERRKNVIKISESLEMERNLGVRKESEKKKEKEVIVKKKPISSRVVTITDPEGPEISSIIKVKPREFIAKDKQANKALILKAVADAEKSIATVPLRTEPEVENKKAALFTKNLRGKRYEKLAVTLSNIRNSPDMRERLSRRISVDSEKSGGSRNKLDSSEVSEGVRGKSDLLSRKMSKSDDQFISSKTTVMEKNDKYIRCWLEGVEKAVKDDEMVNPNDMDDSNINSNLSMEVGGISGAENDEDDEMLIDDVERKRKRDIEKSEKKEKLSEKELESLRVIPNSKGGNGNDGPQIVVTLDGLDSKTIKDIISRNKKASNGPILSEGKEKSSKESRKSGFEKISDRFGRLNKVNEEGDSDRGRDEGEDRKALKRGKTETDKTEMNSTKSKNRELIAQLSEKFGKVDRKFEDRKRKYPEDDRRYLYESRKGERENSERNGKYKRSDRRLYKEGLSSSPPSKFSSSSSSRQICKYGGNCKSLDCRYYHPKKCRFDEDCSNPDCKYVHSESSSRKKTSRYGRS